MERLDLRPFRLVGYRQPTVVVLHEQATERFTVTRNDRSLELLDYRVDRFQVGRLGAGGGPVRGVCRTGQGQHENDEGK